MTYDTVTVKPAVAESVGHAEDPAMREEVKASVDLAWARQGVKAAVADAAWAKR